MVTPGLNEAIQEQTGSAQSRHCYPGFRSGECSLWVSAARYRFYFIILCPKKRFSSSSVSSEAFLIDLALSCVEDILSPFYLCAQFGGPNSPHLHLPLRMTFIRLILDS